MALAKETEKQQLEWQEGNQQSAVSRGAEGTCSEGGGCRIGTRSYLWQPGVTHGLGEGWREREREAWWADSSSGRLVKGGGAWGWHGIKEGGGGG